MVATGADAEFVNITEKPFCVCYALCLREFRCFKTRFIMFVLPIVSIIVVYHVLIRRTSIPQPTLFTLKH